MSRLSTLRSRAREEEGSILLAFLGILMLTGLLVAVTATVIAGEKQNRFDRTYEGALLLAESGHSRIQSLIQSNPMLTPAELVAAASPRFTADPGGDASSTPWMRGTEPDGTYAVMATKSVTTTRPAINVRWKLRAVGSALNGRTRTIESELVIRPLFGLAAFGKSVLRMNGDNAADSFFSTEGTGSAPQNTDICLRGAASTYANLGTPTSGIDSNQTEVNMCDPANRGVGVVATNGTLDLQGQVPTEVDIMEVHNARDHVTDPLPNATGNCDGPRCPDVYASGKLAYYREPIELPAINACNFGASSTGTSYGAGAVFGGSVYDVQNLDLYGDTVFGGTSASPTVLCVRGNVTVHSHHLINFQNAGTSAAPRWVPRRPGTLFIFVTGGSNSQVSLETNSAISAAIYAPGNVISCGSQGNVFGSIVGNDISCLGGFRFHYDQALGDNLTYPAVRAENWREITG